VILGILGAVLGGIGIAGFGGAIGLPLALLLAPVGIVLGNEFDAGGVSKSVVRKIRQFFGSSEVKDSNDDTADSANEEFAVLLELLTEMINRCDALEHAHAEVAARCNAVEQENVKLNAQLISLKSLVEATQKEVRTLRQRTMYLGWGLCLVLISVLVWRFFQ